MHELQHLLAAHRGAGGDADATLLPLFDDAAFRAGGYRDGALLRFRGVVRDVQDPELVLLAGAHDEAHEAREADEADAAERFQGAQPGKGLVERVPLKVALFPHRTSWAARAFDGDTQHQRSSGASAAVVAGGRAKRSNEAVDDGGADGEKEVATTTAALKSENSASDALSKKPKAAATVPQQLETAPFLQNLISVYVYEGQYEGIPLDAFKVNEAFDFVGVLDLTVLGAAARATADAAEVLSADELQRLQISERLDEIQQRQRSGAVVHCCAAASVSPFHHVRPHQPRHVYTKLQESNAEKLQYCADEWARLGAVTTAGGGGGGGTSGSALAAVREQLVQHLSTVALGGDALAAEYLLLCLLSRVYARPDATTPLGNLSLNLALGSSLSAAQVGERVDRIEAAICTLVPVCSTVDLALETLNESTFTPHKDYETDAMVSGALQVPHGTVLVVKETSLTAGQLNDQGVRNVGALQALVAKMVLPYDFQYYSMDFPQDVAVVSVSEGKSILPVTVAVPLAAGNNIASASPAGATEALLESFRVYVGVLRTLEISIGNEQAETAEKHYVACRQAKQEVSVRVCVCVCRADGGRCDLTPLCVALAAGRPAPLAARGATRGAESGRGRGVQGGVGPHARARSTAYRAIARVAVALSQHAQRLNKSTLSCSLERFSWLNGVPLLVCCCCLPVRRCPLLDHDNQELLLCSAAPHKRHERHERVDRASERERVGRRTHRAR